MPVMDLICYTAVSKLLTFTAFSYVIEMRNIGSHFHIPCVDIIS